MFSEELQNFCEFHAISILRFLQDNFVLESKKEKYNKRRKKWMIKHDEIKCLPLIIPVSIHFAHRYEELVDMGKIIIVRDDTGKYQAYINPKTIILLNRKEQIERKLKEISRKVYTLDNLDEGYKIKSVLEKQLESINEDERIVRHFLGEDSINYSQTVGEKLMERALVKNSI